MSNLYSIKKRFFSNSSSELLDFSFINRLIQTSLLLLLSNFAYSQSIGLGLYNGYDFDKFTRLEVKESSFDSTYRTTSTVGNEGNFKGSIGLNFYRQNYSSYDIIFGFNNYSTSLFEPNRIVRDTSGTITFFDTSIGRNVRKNYSLGLHIFRPFATRNERVKVLWGYGADAFFFYSDIKEIKSTKLFRHRRRKTGIGAKFLGKAVYQTKNRRFLFEGIFGINVLDFGVDDSKNFNPNLTLRQQTNYFYDFDMPLAPTWRVGIIYLFNPILKRQTLEKTQNE